MPSIGIVVELEGVAQIGERPAVDPHARVDLLAAVAPRVAERELPVGANLESPLVSDRVSMTIDVAVLDRQTSARPRAPDDVPGAHALAGERALDARLRERLEHARRRTRRSRRSGRRRSASRTPS